MHAHHLCDDFNRTFGTEAFARSNVHLISNGIQSLLAVSKHVRTRGQVMANPAFAYRHRPAFCYAKLGIKQRTSLPKRGALLPVLSCAGLYSQPWKALANWPWAG